MKLTFDLDTIMFKLMKAAFASASLTGDVYKGSRLLNSVKEDVVVNTITLSQLYAPQLGTSNINIHVPDKNVQKNGIVQNIIDDARLNQLTAIAVEAIRNAEVKDLSIAVEFQTIIEEDEIKQHYSNIRVSWSIH